MRCRFCFSTGGLVGISLDAALLDVFLALGWGWCALRARRTAAARKDFVRLSASVRDFQVRVETEAAALRELEASAAKLRAQLVAERAELAGLQASVARARHVADAARAITISGASWRRR